MLVVRVDECPAALPTFLPEKTTAAEQCALSTFVDTNTKTKINTNTDSHENTNRETDAPPQKLLSIADDYPENNAHFPHFLNCSA